MLSSFLYHKGKPLETNISRADMLRALQEKEAVLWVDFEDPNEFETDALVEIFNFHDLAIEDCLSDNSHPKVDDYEEYLFLVAHALYADLESNLQTIELDLFLGKNYVVTFRKKAIKGISQIQENAQKKPETLLGYGPDRLAHAILDQLVDHYLPVLDEYDAKIESLEGVLFNGNSPHQNVLATLMEIKRDIHRLRHIVVPQRDMLNQLTRTPTVFIKPKHLMYYRDIYDHLFQIYQVAEDFHETLNSLLRAYFSYSSHKLNEIMKRMTVLATLTMPSMVIASVYGMNFRNIPELQWRYGFYVSLGTMFLVSIVMLLWMKRKKWI